VTTPEMRRRQALQRRMMARTVVAAVLVMLGIAFAVAVLVMLYQAFCGGQIR